MVRRFNSRFPTYPDDADYTTNSPSYYDYLARLNKLMKVLAEKLGHYDEELEKRFEEWDKLIEKFPENVEKLLIEWLEDGILEEIINVNIFKDLNDLIDKNKGNIEENKNKIDNIIEELEKYSDRDKVVYTVGESGDFDTINNAIKDIEKMLVYPNEVEIKLLNDYIMKEQVIINNRDYSFITISSVNTVSCELVDNIKTITTMNGAKYTPFFHIKNSLSPKINALFKQSTPYNDMLPRVTGCVLENSEIIVNEKMGFINFSWGGLVLLDKSNGVAVGGNFSGNGNYYQIKDPTEEEVRTAYKGKGVLVQNSNFTGDKLKANNCGDVGVHVQLASNARFSGAEIISCGHHAIVVSQASSVTARSGVYTLAYDDNVVCETSSSLDISYSDCSNARYHNGIVAHRTGNIIFIEGKANNNSGWGIHAVNDGHINAEGATSNGNGKSGISTGRMGYVYFRWGTSNGNKKHGINVSKISHVVAVETEINDNGGKGVAVSGGECDVSQSEIKNNGESGVASVSGGKVTISSNITDISYNNDYGVLVEQGEVNLREGTVSNNSKGDIRVASSGVIHGDDIRTTDTKKAMYIVSSGGIVHVSNSKGYANMKINTFQERGLVMSNSLKQVGE